MLLKRLFKWKLHRKRKLLLVLYIVGILFMSFGAYFYFKNTDKKIPTSVIQEPKKEVPLHTTANPIRLDIGGGKIDLPVIEGKIVDGVWETTQEGVSHLTISANPGENGNIVIYGHNKKGIFGSLPYVSMGAIIKVTTEDGVTHKYKVYAKKQVSANDVSIVYATPSEVLTLYTCDGPLDAKRFVLLAKPIAN